MSEVSKGKPVAAAIDRIYDKETIEALQRAGLLFISGYSVLELDRNKVLKHPMKGMDAQVEKIIRSMMTVYSGFLERSDRFAIEKRERIAIDRTKQMQKVEGSVVIGSNRDPDEEGMEDEGRSAEGLVIGESSSFALSHEAYRFTQQVETSFRLLTGKDLRTVVRSLDAPDEDYVPDEDAGEKREPLTKNDVDKLVADMVRHAVESDYTVKDFDTMDSSVRDCFTSIPSLGLGDDPIIAYNMLKDPDIDGAFRSFMEYCGTVPGYSNSSYRILRNGIEYLFGEGTASIIDGRKFIDSKTGEEAEEAVLYKYIGGFDTVEKKRQLVTLLSNMFSPDGEGSAYAKLPIIHQDGKRFYVNRHECVEVFKMMGEALPALMSCAKAENGRNKEFENAEQGLKARLRENIDYFGSVKEEDIRNLQKAYLNLDSSVNFYMDPENEAVIKDHLVAIELVGALKGLQLDLAEALSNPAKGIMRMRSASRTEAEGREDKKEALKAEYEYFSNAAEVANNPLEDLLFFSRRYHNALSTEYKVEELMRATRTADEGSAGWIFSPDDERNLSRMRALKSAASDERKRMGREIDRLVGGISVEDVRKYLDEVLGNPVHNTVDKMLGAVPAGEEAYLGPLNDILQEDDLARIDRIRDAVVGAHMETERKRSVYGASAERLLSEIPDSVTEKLSSRMVAGTDPYNFITLSEAVKALIQYNARVMLGLDVPEKINIPMKDGSPFGSVFPAGADEITALKSMVRFKIEELDGAERMKDNLLSLVDSPSPEVFFSLFKSERSSKRFMFMEKNFGALVDAVSPPETTLREMFPAEWERARPGDAEKSRLAQLYHLDSKASDDFYCFHSAFRHLNDNLLSYFVSKSNRNLPSSQIISITREDGSLSSDNITNVAARLSEYSFNQDVESQLANTVATRARRIIAEKLSSPDEVEKFSKLPVQDGIAFLFEGEEPELESRAEVFKERVVDYKALLSALRKPYSSETQRFLEKTGRALLAEQEYLSSVEKRNDFKESVYETVLDSCGIVRSAEKSSRSFPKEWGAGIFLDERDDREGAYVVNGMLADEEVPESNLQPVAERFLNGEVYRIRRAMEKNPPSKSIWNMDAGRAMKEYFKAMTDDDYFVNNRHITDSGMIIEKGDIPVIAALCTSLVDDLRRSGKSTDMERLSRNTALLRTFLADCGNSLSFMRHSARNLLSESFKSEYLSTVGDYLDDFIEAGNLSFPDKTHGVKGALDGREVLVSPYSGKSFMDVLKDTIRNSAEHAARKDLRDIRCPSGYFVDSVLNKKSAELLLGNLSDEEGMPSGITAILESVAHDDLERLFSIEHETPDVLRDRYDLYLGRAVQLADRIYEELERRRVEAKEKGVELYEPGNLPSRDELVAPVKWNVAKAAYGGRAGEFVDDIDTIGIEAENGRKTLDEKMSVLLEYLSGSPVRKDVEALDLLVSAVANRREHLVEEDSLGLMNDIADKASRFSMGHFTGFEETEKADFLHLASEEVYKAVLGRSLNQFFVVTNSLDNSSASLLIDYGECWEVFKDAYEKTPLVMENQKEITSDFIERNRAFIMDRMLSNLEGTAYGEDDEKKAELASLVDGLYDNTLVSVKFPAICNSWINSLNRNISSKQVLSDRYKDIGVVFDGNMFVDPLEADIKEVRDQTAFSRSPVTAVSLDMFSSTLEKLLPGTRRDPDSLALSASNARDELLNERRKTERKLSEYEKILASTTDPKRQFEDAETIANIISDMRNGVFNYPDASWIEKHPGVVAIPTSFDILVKAAEDLRANNPTEPDVCSKMIECLGEAGRKAVENAREHGVSLPSYNIYEEIKDLPFMDPASKEGRMLDNDVASAHAMGESAKNFLMKKLGEGCSFADVIEHEVINKGNPPSSYVVRSRLGEAVVDLGNPFRETKNRICEQGIARCRSRIAAIGNMTRLVSDPDLVSALSVESRVSGEFDHLAEMARNVENHKFDVSALKGLVPSAVDGYRIFSYGLLPVSVRNENPLEVRAAFIASANRFCRDVTEGRPGLMEQVEALSRWTFKVGSKEIRLIDMPEFDSFRRAWYNIPADDATVKEVLKTVYSKDIEAGGRTFRVIDDPVLSNIASLSSRIPSDKDISRLVSEASRRGIMEDLMNRVYSGTASYEGYEVRLIDTPAFEKLRSSWNPTANRDRICAGIAKNGGIAEFVFSSIRPGLVCNPVDSIYRTAFGKSEEYVRTEDTPIDRVFNAGRLLTPSKSVLPTERAVIKENMSARKVRDGYLDPIFDSQEGFMDVRTDEKLVAFSVPHGVGLDEILSAYRGELSDPKAIGYLTPDRFHAIRGGDSGILLLECGSVPDDILAEITATPLYFEEGTIMPVTRHKDPSSVLSLMRAESAMTVSNMLSRGSGGRAMPEEYDGRLWKDEDGAMPKTISSTNLFKASKNGAKIGRAGTKKRPSSARSSKGEGRNK